MVINIHKKQQGIAAVEFAIVLPVMLFLMLGTAEFGRVFYQYTTLSKAVQSGARYASKQLLKNSELANLDSAFVKRVQNFVVYGNEMGTGTAVLDGFAATGTNVAISSSVANKTITIEAQYNYSFGVLGDLSLFGYSMPTVTMRSSAVTDASLG